MHTCHGARRGRASHTQHHQYRNTVSYAAEYAHVADQILANAIPTYSGPLLFNMHASVIYIWYAISAGERVCVMCVCRQCNLCCVCLEVAIQCSIAC